MKFRKKPVIIEAMQLNDKSSRVEIIHFTNGLAKYGVNLNLIIPTLEGEMIANVGDWIIQGVNGEFYPCKPDIFEKTYERVN